MRYGSVCSGIEAATVAWHPLGWKPSFFSEIEAFPRAVLSHHYPDVPLHGDFTTIKGDEYDAIDLLVGGTPCQSFSVAGLRGGLADDRGNLALEYLRLADRTRPRWLVWENVPGVLSSNGGRDFGAILGGMVELGYGFAYRVLDAQFVRVDGFGRAVPQRRRRVFVVGYLGDWRPAAAVLFERQGLRGDPAPRRKAGQAVAALTANGVGTCGADDNQGQAGHLVAHASEVARCVTACHTATGRLDPNEMEFVAHSLRAEGFDASEDGTGRGTPLGPVAYRTAGDGAVYEEGDVTAPLTTATDPNANILAFSCKDYGADSSMNCAPTLRAMGHSDSHANAGGQLAVAHPYTLAIRGRGDGHQLEYRQDGTANAILTPNGGRAGIGVGAIATAWAVRRLTPMECERLQGFPDTKNYVTIRVWSSEHQKNCARAETQSLKSQTSALNAGASASRPSANAAGLSSNASHRGPGKPAAVHVLIDLERSVLQLRNLNGSNWSASIAEPVSSSPLSMPIDAFARLIAHMPPTQESGTQAGKVASQPNTRLSSLHQSGSALVHLSGQEIGALASDATRFTTAADLCMKSTTSEVGPNSQSYEQTWETWSSCVVAAIAGFIPEQTRNASSYDICVETLCGYTAIPHRGKLAADGPRYKALGNSMAVNAMRWIGQRIDTVDRMISIPQPQAAE